MVVPGFPAENSKTETDLLIESGGGPAANAAWLLARWGVSTAIAGVVGDDQYGRRAIAELREADVDCRLMKQLPGQPTPVSFIISNRCTGSRTIINRKAPGTNLDLPVEALAGLEPKLLLFDGHETEASLLAIQTFPNAITILDAGSLRDGTRRLAGCVRYLVTSERFAVQITGEKDVAGNGQPVLKQLRQISDGIIVVTLGEHGLIYDDCQQQGRLPALSAEVKDTTAAGDIFHGAFAFALLEEMQLGQALCFATIAAGLSVQQFGGRTSTPDLCQVRETMANESKD
jgi:sugar/nucleoside kinase (ribokinase family)